jgi:hypothetical protein
VSIDLGMSGAEQQDVALESIQLAFADDSREIVSFAVTDVTLRPGRNAIRAACNVSRQSITKRVKTDSRLLVRVCILYGWLRLISGRSPLSTLLIMLVRNCGYIGIQRDRVRFSECRTIVRLS